MSTSHTVNAAQFTTCANLDNPGRLIESLQEIANDPHDVNASGAAELQPLTVTSASTFEVAGSV
jgi:hypothetical protein